MLKKYQTETYWKKYQRFFPLRAHVTSENAPDEEWFEWHGASIHIDRYPCREAPLTIIVVHGGGGYGRLFAPVGLLLRKAGYEVVAPDLPGYGLSKNDSSMVRYDVWIRMLSDLVASEYKRNGRRIVLCGGSLGGYLAYLSAAQLGSELIAGIIATTLIDPRLRLAKEQLAKNSLVLHGMMPLMPLFAKLAGNLKLPIKWFTKMGAMSNDSELSQLVAEDPFGGGVRVPVSFMQSIFSVRPAMEPENFDICPVLLAHPAADRWSSIESSRPFFDRIKGDKTLVLLEKCGHFPVEEPGISQLEHAAIAFLAKIADNSGARQTTTI